MALFWNRPLYLGRSGSSRTASSLGGLVAGKATGVVFRRAALGWAARIGGVAEAGWRDSRTASRAKMAKLMETIKSAAIANAKRGVMRASERSGLAVQN